MAVAPKKTEEDDEGLNDESTEEDEEEVETVIGEEEEEDDDEASEEEEDEEIPISEIMDEATTETSYRPLSSSTAAKVNPNERITKPYLTKYEKTRIIGIRAQQIAHGSLPMVGFDISKKPDPVDIATLELREKKTPLILRRKLPGGKYEDWKINELTDNLLD